MAGDEEEAPVPPADGPSPAAGNAPAAAVTATVTAAEEDMVSSFKVFKKSSPNGKVTVYLGKRDFVDHISSVDPIDGVLLVDPSYLDGRQVYGQVICSFRYGREEDEVMGLNFQKDIYLASEQVYPSVNTDTANMSKLQERLLKKLGPHAVPFTFHLPQNAPSSVTLQPGETDQGAPCGVEYILKLFVGDSELDRSHKRATVALNIRKVQYSPSKGGRQPCTVVRKDFMLSPGELELEATLDKQLYHHGESVAVNICIRNHSNKTVKRIKCSIQQGVEVCIFSNGSYKATVASFETEEGCPVEPGQCLQKVIMMTPSLENNNRRGIALDGKLKQQDTGLASSTLLANPDQRDVFGIVVSYSAKVKLFLGALGGELVAELPFVLMHPKPSAQRPLQHVASTEQLETFRSDSIDLAESDAPPATHGNGAGLTEPLTGLRLRH
ncbi:arrestin homolog [Amphibalanus amphitrite]|uniref:arrestin homolog n=1 Tax=Amphibalanus amphitrite TaxID=1232801 RepID=UPI001C90B707|nr:arrestin homolog [Amphibalanus amphitrite]